MTRGRRQGRGRRGQSWGLSLALTAGIALTSTGGCRTTTDGLGEPAPDGDGLTTTTTTMTPPPRVTADAGQPPSTAPVAVDTPATPGVDAARAPSTDGGSAPEVAPPAVQDAASPVTDSAAPAACSAGQVFCSGRIPQTCGADGRWVNGPACAYACQGGCVNRFSAVSSGRGSPTSDDGLAEFSRNDQTFFSARGGLLGARGFNVAVLDAASGTPVDAVKNFDPWTSPLSGSALTELAAYLEAIEPGRLVLIATCDDAGINRIGSCDKHDSAPVQRLLATLRALGSTQIDGYCYRGAWSLVTVVGQRRALAEKLSPGARITAEVMLPALP